MRPLSPSDDGAESARRIADGGAMHGFLSRQYQRSQMPQESRKPALDARQGKREQRGAKTLKQAGISTQYRRKRAEKPKPTFCVTET